MKKAATHLKKGPGDPRRQVFFLYRRSLERYLSGGGEGALRGAYEVGRLGLAKDLGLLDMAALHRSALMEVLIRAPGREETQAKLSAASQFFAESLSRYEMAYRAYSDAMAAMHLLNDTLEKEANRIARAVHDEAGHLLLAVHLAMAEIARDLPPALRRKIKDVIDLLHQAEGQLRGLSHELHPTALHDLGLAPAVRLLADGVSKRFSLSIGVEATLDGRLPATVEIALYRIMQEALTNITKHARAKNVWIQLDGDARRICCSIRDDGVGFCVRAPRRHRGLGLIGIQERLSAIGGTLQTTSAPGTGTLLLVTVPRKKTHVNPGNACR